MGMYDTFIIKNKEIKCPHCAKALVGSDANDYMDFQTKDLDPSLDTFYFPDVYPHHKIKGSIHIYTSCIHCKGWINALMYTKDNVFNKLAILPVKKGKLKKKQIIKVPYSPELKELLLEKNKLKNQNREYLMFLEALIFSVYNGDTLEIEKIARMEKRLNLDVVKRFKTSFGTSIKTKENLFSALSYLSEAYHLLHEDLVDKDSSKK